MKLSNKIKNLAEYLLKSAFRKMEHYNPRNPSTVKAMFRNLLGYLQFHEGSIRSKASAALDILEDCEDLESLIDFYIINSKLFEALTDEDWNMFSTNPSGELESLKAAYKRLLREFKELAVEERPEAQLI